MKGKLKLWLLFALQISYASARSPDFDLISYTTQERTCAGKLDSRLKARVPTHEQDTRFSKKRQKEIDDATPKTAYRGRKIDLTMPEMSTEKFVEAITAEYVQDFFYVVGGILFLLYATNFFLTRRWTTTWSKLDVPGPPCSTIFGNTFEIEKMGGLRPAVRAWFEKYGKIFGFHIGKQPVIVIAEPGMAEEVLECMDDTYFNRYDVPHNLQEELGDKTLFLTKDKTFETQHYIMSIIFCNVNMAFLIPRLNRCGKHIAAYLADIAQNADTQEKYNLKDLVHSYSFDTIAAMLAGLKTDHFRKPEENDLLKCLNKVFKNVEGDYCGVTLSTKFREVGQYIEDRIKERRGKPRDAEMIDLIDMFMYTQSEAAGALGDLAEGVQFPVYGFAETEAVANLVFWVLHAHETLVSSLLFVFNMLAHFPKHQRIVAAEIKTNIKSDEPNYSEYFRLPFTDLFIKEALRLFSPVQEIWRYTSQHTHIEEFIIPAKTAVLLPVHLIHSDEDYFIDPLEFEPERYFHRDKENKNSDVFLSFCCGPRACVGSELALLQMKAALIRICRDVIFKSAANETGQAERNKHLQIQCGLIVTDEGLLRPYNVMRLKLAPRRRKDIVLIQSEDEEEEDTKDKRLRGMRLAFFLKKLYDKQENKFESPVRFTRRKTGLRHAPEVQKGIQSRKLVDEDGKLVDTGEETERAKRPRTKKELDKLENPTSDTSDKTSGGVTSDTDAGSTGKKKKKKGKGGDTTATSATTSPGATSPSGSEAGDGKKKKKGGSPTTTSGSETEGDAGKKKKKGKEGSPTTSGTETAASGDAGDKRKKKKGKGGSPSPSGTETASSGDEGAKKKKKDKGGKSTATSDSDDTSGSKDKKKKKGESGTDSGADKKKKKKKK